MVTKVQNGRQIQKSSDLGEIWFPSRLWCSNWYSSLVCYGARNWMKLSRNFVWHVYT
jgi:hypothetical protein